MACLDAGDEIIVPEPFYANYVGFAMAAGIHIIPITSSITTGFALPPIASFKEKITPKTKAIITVSLYGLSPEYDDILQICNEFNLFLIEDNAECFLGYYKVHMFIYFSYKFYFSNFTFYFKFLIAPLLQLLSFIN